MASETTIVTREKTGIWLIGQERESLCGRELLSLQTLLQYHFYLVKIQKLKVRESSSKVIRECMIMWDLVKIPIRRDFELIQKFEKVLNCYALLKKNKENDNAPQTYKRIQFKEIIKKVFDMSQQKNLKDEKIIKIYKDLIEGRSKFNSIIEPASILKAQLEDSTKNEGKLHIFLYFGAILLL